MINNFKMKIFSPVRLLSNIGLFKFGTLFARNLSSKILPVGIQGAGFGGGQLKSGLEEGPNFIRGSGFIELLKEEVGHDIKDFGNISFASFEPQTIQTLIYGALPINNVENVAKGNLQIYKSTLEILNEGRIPLTLGGDHSISIGTLNAVTELHPNVGVLWVDAHADLNTPFTTKSGNLHGLPLAMHVLELRDKMQCLKEFDWVTPRIPAKNIAYIGLREFGGKFNPKKQRENIKKLGIKAFTMADVDELGIKEVTSRALEHISPNGKVPIHLSFDVDVLDDLVVGGWTGTSVSGGLNLREGLTLLEQVYNYPIVAADFVEVNPKMKTKFDSVEHERISDLCKHLLGAMFGYRRGGL